VSISLQIGAFLCCFGYLFFMVFTKKGKRFFVARPFAPDKNLKSLLVMSKTRVIVGTGLAPARLDQDRATARVAPTKQRYFCRHCRDSNFLSGAKSQATVK